LNCPGQLFKVYVLKDDLKAIWLLRDRDGMAKALNDWCQRAEEADLAPLNAFVTMLKTHAAGILNHANHPIHTGRLEGTNNKIKVLKRQAYGFHDLDYFALKIKQLCCKGGGALTN
jgi:transposase